MARNARTWWLFLFGSLLIVAAIFVLTARSLPVTSRLVIDGSKLDFGRVVLDQDELKLCGDVVVANPTKVPISIRGIVVSCSCVSVNLKTPAVVDAGQRLVIPVTMGVTRSQRGRVQHSVVVQTDEPRSGVTALTVSARVIPTVRLEFEPKRILLGDVGGWQQVVTSFRLRSYSLDEIVIKSVKCKPDEVTAVFKKIANSSDQELQITIPPSMNQGSIEGSITVETNLGKTEAYFQFVRLGQIFVEENTVCLHPPNKLQKLIKIRHSPEIMLDDIRLSSSSGVISFGQIKAVDDDRETSVVQIFATKSVRKLPIRDEILISSKSQHSKAELSTKLNVFVLE